MSKDQLLLCRFSKSLELFDLFFTHLDTLYDAKMMFGCKVVESLDKWFPFLHTSFGLRVAEEQWTATFLRMVQDYF